MNNLSTNETKEMTKREIEMELGKRAKFLEELGMDYDEAIKFISTVMNLGIGAQAAWDRGER